MTAPWFDQYLRAQRARAIETPEGLEFTAVFTDPAVTMTVSKVAAQFMVPTSLLEDIDREAPPLTARQRRRAMVELHRIRLANWVCAKIAGYKRNHGEDSCGCC